MGLADYTSLDPAVSYDPAVASMPPDLSSQMPPQGPPMSQEVASYQPAPNYSPVPQVSQQPQAAPPQAPGIPYGSPGPGAGGPPLGMSADLALQLAGQGGATRAGFVPGTRSETTEGADIPDEYKQAVADELGANTDQAKASIEAQRAQGAAQAKQQADQMAYDQAMLAAQEQRAAEIKKASDADYSNVVAANKAAADSATTDPHRWWSSKSDFGKVATGITMMLQGFMFGMGRGSDPAAWLNEQIRNDVNDQKSAHEAKQQTASDAINVFQLHKAKLGDDERSTLAAEMAKRSQVIALLQQKSNDASAPAVGRLQLADTARTLAHDNATDMAKFVTLSASKHTTTTAEHFQPGGAGMDVLTRMRRAVEVQKLGNTLTGAAPEGRAAEANIAKTEAETSKLGKEGKPNTAKYDTALDALQEVHRMILGGGTLSRAETGKGQAALGNALAALAEAEGQPLMVRGKMNPAIAQQIGTEDPNEFQFSEKNLATIEQALRNVAGRRARAGGSAPDATVPGEAPIDTSGAD